MKLNKDVVGWITIFDTHISYPVVQGKDNQEYLNKDVFGKFSFSGSIFLDYRNACDFTDSYSIIYGHHMVLNLKMMIIFRSTRQEHCFC